MHLPFYENASFWVEAVLALATGGLFVATYRVATRTAELAKDTVAATRVADKHHQESLTPVVEWVCLAQAKPQYEEPRTAVAAPSGKVEGWDITYTGTIKNVGTGPALNVRAGFLFHTFRFDKSNGYEKHLPSLGPGQGEGAKFYIRLAGNVVSQTPMPYTVTITYDNIFGKQCTTVHTNPGGENQTETTFTPPDTTSRV